MRAATKPLRAVAVSLALAAVPLALVLSWRGTLPVLAFAASLVSIDRP